MLACYDSPKIAPPSRGGNQITLRLTPEAAQRLREEAERSGRTEIGLAEELLGRAITLSGCLAKGEG